MAEYQITCIIHDKDGVITHVGIAKKIYTVAQVVSWIRSEKHNFYTEVNGERAEVYAKQHPTSGRWFLTTNPDGVDENNLDNLPEC